MNGAVTLGNMIFLGPSMNNKNTKDHEYGHYLDFKYHFGFNKNLYLDQIGIPSFISATRGTTSDHDHYKSVSEKRANRLGGAWGKNDYLKNRGR
jgi:hypothetical protein